MIEYNLHKIYSKLPENYSSCLKNKPYAPSSHVSANLPLPDWVDISDIKVGQPVNKILFY
jgi:hypothetical protein